MEEWRKISINDNYEVSSNGRIKRCDNNYEKIPLKSRDGYLITDLYKNGERTRYRVHRLVAQEFIPNPENKPCVNHKDGNKHNNDISNLEWVTEKENCQHAWATGLAKSSISMLGRKNPNAGRHGKPFRIIETGEVFQTLHECEKAIDGNNRHINDCLRGRQNTHRGYHFEYIES